jgi:hypothetical protein
VFGQPPLSPESDPLSQLAKINPTAIIIPTKATAKILTCFMKKLLVWPTPLDYSCIQRIHSFITANGSVKYFLLFSYYYCMKFHTFYVFTFLSTPNESKCPSEPLNFPKNDPISKTPIQKDNRNVPIVPYYIDLWAFVKQFSLWFNKMLIYRGVLKR